MWQNLLGSDVIKDVVDWGTKIIKSLDTTQGKILAIVKAVALLAAYKKVNPLDWVLDITRSIEKDGIKNYIASLFQVSAAQKIVTADTLVATIAQEQNDIVTQKQIVSKLRLTNVTGALTAAQKLQAAQELVTLFNGNMISEDLATRMAAMLGYKFSVDAANQATISLDTTTKSFMSTNPVGWILAIVSAVVLLVTWLSKIPSDLERLEKKMSDLNSEISDLESEIDSLNSELKITQERISELLSMPSLSFVEQEELKNLQLQNAELEKQLELQEMLLESKSKEKVKTSTDLIEKVWNGKGSDRKYAKSEGGAILRDRWYTAGKGGKEVLEEALSSYNLDTKKEIEDLERLYSMAESEIGANGKLSFNTFKSVVEAIPDVGDNPEQYYNQKYRYSDEKLLDMLNSNIISPRRESQNDIDNGIEMVLSDMSKIIEENDLSYSMGDKDINKFLDEYFAYQYKWREVQGISDKSSAIASIFDDTSSESIQKLKEDLSSIASDDSLNAAQKQTKALKLVDKAINSNVEDYSRLKTSMDIIGISADEVARYFVQLSKTYDSSTIEGLTSQYQKGIDALGKYKGVATDVISEFTNLDGSVEQITWSSLFDDEGETIDTQISKVLHGADESVRTEFASIAKAVNEGKISVNNAMKSFSISSVQAGYKLLENSVIEINSDVFKDLGDEISGLIDTFEEFGSALESVANSIKLVNQAQAEMAYSGHLSVETALDLINSTEDWNKVLKVENGNITLVDGAMNILAQSKLNQIKTNLQLALSEAQAGLEQARLAESSGEVAKTLEESTTESVRQLAANMEYLSTLIGEFLSGNFLGAGSAASKAKASSLKSTEYQKTSSASSMSVADWEEKVSNIEAKLGILESVDTPSEFNSNYYSDDVSGGNATKDEVEDDRFQREMDYWENRIGANQAKYEQLQNEIDLLEKKGQKADASFYHHQMALENGRLRLLVDQKKAAEEYIATLTEGSEEWF